MDKITKRLLKSATKGISSFFKNLEGSIMSLFRVFVLSSFKVARQSKHYRELRSSVSCCVLGNGPSLKEDLDQQRVKYVGNDVFCVNMFCLSEYFKVLKPRFYFLIDEAYFNPQTERHKKYTADLMAALKTVDWDMYLVISSYTVTGGALLNCLTNNHIKVISLNSTSVNGFRCFRHWMYRHRLGMPHTQTVINFALCAAINLGYENIYLYGADHTWTRNLFVDDNNVLYDGVQHVFDTKVTPVKKDHNLGHMLELFSKMFKAHYLIEEYAQSVGVKIWNCACDTFLDAYERLK